MTRRSSGRPGRKRDDEVNSLKAVVVCVPAPNAEERLRSAYYELILRAAARAKEYVERDGPDSKGANDNGQ